MSDVTNLRTQLQYWRKRRGLSMQKLAELSGVSTATFVKMEKDSSYIPISAVIDRLCAALSISREQLIVDIEEQDHAPGPAALSVA